MTALHAMGLFIAVYLALLGRSAWRQGELRQFVLSLAVVTTLLTAIAGAVWLAMALSPR